MGLLQRKTSINLIHLDSYFSYNILFELNCIYIYSPFNIAASWSTTCLRYQKGQCKPFSPFMLTLKLNCHFFKKFLKIRYSLRLGYKNMPLTKDSPYCHWDVWAYLELVMMFSLNTIYNIQFQKSGFQASNGGCLCRI